MINAFAAHGPQKTLEPFSYHPGELQPNDVEIDVRYCGICHSDLSIIDNEWGNTIYPVVPGHEIIGILIAVGNQVKHLNVGQTVGLGWHAGYCNICEPCHAGDHNLCENSQATIIDHHGGFADTVRATANSVIPIPEGLDLPSASPLFCGGITVFNPLLEFGIKPTDHVAVIGVGGLGHMAIQFLNAWGCHVTAFTSNEAKREEALTLGAHHTLSSRHSKDIESAKNRFDFIISTVNVTLDWNLYINTLRPRGRLHMVGATLNPLDLNVFSLIVGQHSVSGSPVGSPRTIAMMLNFVHRHAIKPVVETFPFDQVNEALARLRSGQARYRIVLCRSDPKHQNVIFSFSFGSMNSRIVL